MGDVRDYSTKLGLVGGGVMAIGTLLGWAFGSIVPYSDIFFLGATLFLMGCLGVCWTFNLPEQKKKEETTIIRETQMKTS